MKCSKCGRLNKRSTSCAVFALFMSESDAAEPDSDGTEQQRNPGGALIALHNKVKDQPGPEKVMNFKSA